MIRQRARHNAAMRFIPAVAPVAAISVSARAAITVRRTLLVLIRLPLGNISAKSKYVR